MEGLSKSECGLWDSLCSNIPQKDKENSFQVEGWALGVGHQVAIASQLCQLQKAFQVPTASQLGSQLLVASPQNGITSLSPLRIKSAAGRTRWKFGQELLGEEEDVNGTKGKRLKKGTRSGVATNVSLRIRQKTKQVSLETFKSGSNSSASFRLLSSVPKLTPFKLLMAPES